MLRPSRESYGLAEAWKRHKRRDLNTILNCSYISQWVSLTHTHTSMKRVTLNILQTTQGRISSCLPSAWNLTKVYILEKCQVCPSVDRSQPQHSICSQRGPILRWNYSPFLRRAKVRKVKEAWTTTTGHDHVKQHWESHKSEPLVHSWDRISSCHRSPSGTKLRTNGIFVRCSVLASRSWRADSEQEKTIQAKNR